MRSDNFTNTRKTYMLSWLTEEVVESHKCPGSKINDMAHKRSNCTVYLYFISLNTVQTKYNISLNVEDLLLRRCLRFLISINLFRVPLVSSKFHQVSLPELSLCRTYSQNDAFLKHSLIKSRISRLSILHILMVCTSYFLLSSVLQQSHSDLTCVALY